MLLGSIEEAGAVEAAQTLASWTYLSRSASRPTGGSCAMVLASLESLRYTTIFINPLHRAQVYRDLEE